jgi:hypothetical protein
LERLRKEGVRSRETRQTLENGENRETVSRRIALSGCASPVVHGGDEHLGTGSSEHLVTVGISDWTTATSASSEHLGPGSSEPASSDTATAALGAGLGT